MKDVHLSNGMAWNEDQTCMFFNDSLPRKVYSFDYSPENGEISNQRVFKDYFHDVERLGLPDGMTIDMYALYASHLTPSTVLVVI